MKTKLIVFLFFIVLFNKLSAQCGTLNIQLMNTTNSSTFMNCDGSVEVSISGGTPTYSFYWFPGSLTWEDSVYTIKNGLCQGNHKLYVKDGNNCIDTLIYSIGGPPYPCSNYSLTVTKQNATSALDCDGSATFHLLGAEPPLQITSPISWTDSTSSAICPGFNYIRITDNNGCTQTAAFDINYPGSCNEFFQSVSIIEASATNSACDGSLIAGTIGGTPPFSYSWYSDLNPTVFSTSSNITNVCSGVYILEITDANGCVNTERHTVGCTGITATASSTDNLTFNGCEGTLSSTVIGGYPPYVYHWSTGMNTPNVSNVCPRVYTVEIKDSIGCFASATTEVKNPAHPTPCDDFTMTLFVVEPATDQFSCNMILNSFGYNGTPPYSYFWQPTELLQQHDSSACPISGTLYSCTVTDSRGCAVTQYTNSYTYAYVETIPLNPDSTTRACGGSAAAYGYAGITPYSFTWDNGETVSTATNLCEGLHAVYFEDAVNYRDTSWVVVSTEINTYLNNQTLPIGNYVYSNPIEDCSINYSNISNISISSYQILGPNRIRITWEILHSNSSLDYLSNIYTVIPSNVVEFILGLYCESGSNYFTARDRINFNPIITSASNINLKNEGIIIYPNPFNNEFTVVTEKTNSKLTLTDALGRQLYSTLITDRTTIIDAQNIPPGFYFINIINGSTIQRSKVVKSK